MIRYDVTRFSVVTVCSCGWQDVTVSMVRARAIAVEHERGSHPDVWQVRTAERMRLARAAARGVPIRGDTDAHDAD